MVHPVAATTGQRDAKDGIDVQEAGEVVEVAGVDEVVDNTNEPQAVRGPTTSRGKRRRLIRHGLAEPNCDLRLTAPSDFGPHQFETNLGKHQQHM